MRALHLKFEGISASFRHPLILSGTQICTPVPAYSNILGMLSACAGRPVYPVDTRVGFEFHCTSMDIELERTNRLSMNKSGKLDEQRKGQGISYRQVLWAPSLDLYVTNLNLGDAVRRPAATPCFGRSQDIAWITLVEEVDLLAVTQGCLGQALIPYPQPEVGGMIVRLPEWFKNTNAGFSRKPGPLGHYHAMSPLHNDLRIEIERANLFLASDRAAINDVIYLHDWLAA